jgi:hypothetical protein
MGTLWVLGAGGAMSVGWAHHECVRRSWWGGSGVCVRVAVSLFCVVGTYGRWIDLSNNSLSGPLPSDLFKGLKLLR